MEKSPSTVARQIAQAAVAFERRRTGNDHAPRAVSVVLSADTVVITLHGALSPAERALARTPEGAAEVREFHRRLFAASCDALRRQIASITGVEVLEAAAEVEASSGAVVHVLKTGTMVQVFQLAQGVPVDAWAGSAADAGP